MTDTIKSKIYCIKFCIGLYIGSSSNSLTDILKYHKNNKNSPMYKYTQHYRDNGYSNISSVYTIELLEENEYASKEILNRKVGEYIKKYKEDKNYRIINKKITGRTYTEWIVDNKKIIDDIIKEFDPEYAKNREELIAFKKSVKDYKEKIKAIKNGLYNNESDNDNEDGE